MPASSAELPSTLIPLDKIVVPPERQRDNAKADGALCDSIARDGLLNPIVVHQQGSGHDITYVLVAGERRLDAHRQLKRTSIRGTILESLDPRTAFRIELAENVARKQLSWQQETKAVADYHAMQLQHVGAMWNQRGTAADLGMSETDVSRKLAVAKWLSDDEVAACPTLQGAFNLLEGRAQRALAAAQSRGVDVVAGISAALPPSIPVGATKEEKTRILMQNMDLGATVTTALDSTAKALEVIAAGAEATTALAAVQQEERKLAGGNIVTADFLEWAAEYEGPKFDVLHVDFPYGKGYKGSNTRRTGKAHINPTYADDPDIYFGLVDGLCNLQDRIAFPAAHMIFWFDMQYYAWTIERLTQAGWTLVQPFPLIWTKGYTGVASDTKRRPRHCYETALMFSRGDRRISKLVNDHFECPLDESKLHLNQKPLPMLRHFLSLVVDEHTALLDPTCGSGSAVAAAMQLRAARVLGVELDPANADVARYLIQKRAPVEEQN
jgi:ParB/RepB/Spo0J family partition protein